MHLHSRSAERTNSAQRSVVKGIPIDPQQNGGDAGVEQLHGLHSFGSVSPVRASEALESRNEVALCHFM
ncbi:hypothetical protein ACF1HJ_02665 [Streptomyces sp. NPDC013978]|uniref:hypothetical protein n=1 Tax=Streptomyces sp. NPDC013978 TaxID=3364869 RepID=UPI0036F8DE5A